MMMVAPTLVITTLAEYQTVFWVPICERLMAQGHDVFVMAFCDRSADMLEARKIPVARMSELGEGPDGPEAFAARLAEYGIDDINLLFSHERVTFRIRDTARLARAFMRYSNAVERVLDQLEKDGKPLLLLQELGGFISVITSFFGARRRGYDNWFIEPAFFRGRLFLYKNTFAAFDIPGPIAPKVSREVSDYLRETLERRAIVIPKKDKHQYAAVFGKVVNTRNIKRLIEKVYDKHVLGKHQDFGHIGVYVRSHLSMIVNAWRTRALHQPLESAGRFVYYPLHVPADAALTLRAPSCLDQLAIVDYLLRIVPASHRVAIKEHPAQVGALPSHRLRALTERYDNLVILPHTTNNFAVLERADAIVSVNSKTGAEALLMGRPVLVLGDAFYSNSPLVTRVKTLTDLPAALRAALAAPKPEPGAVAGYFQNEPYFDMDSVEVFRGPQGTFVGKNAAGGAVFINTRTPELDKTYALRQIKLGTFETTASCQLVLPAPTSKPWPTSCADVNGAAITGAIDDGAVGYLHLNGKRLGNLSAIEAIPNQAILGFHTSQVALLGARLGRRSLLPRRHVGGLLSLRPVLLRGAVPAAFVVSHIGDSLG